jgi:serine/threonine protein kinase
MSTDDQRIDALSTGCELQSYVVERVLGSGAFGITYMAKHRHLGTLHVIKEYLPDCGAREHNQITVRPKSASDKELFAWGLKCFFDEAKLLHQLSHPNVVKVSDLFEANGTAYFVMPYLRGVTLHQWMKHHPRPSQDELESIFVPLLEGLKYIHERGLLHRDIKPENIFITDKINPILIDFGSARMAIGEKSKILTQVLTPHFAPIEQYRSKGTFTPAMDLYSLAACMYQAVTGEMPEEAPNRLEVDNQPRLVGSAYEQRYLPIFLRAIDKNLSIHAKDRHQNGFDLQKALLGLGMSEVTVAAQRLEPINQSVADNDQFQLHDKSSDKHSSSIHSLEYPMANRWPRFFARIFDLWWEMVLVNFSLSFFLSMYSSGFLIWMSQPGSGALFSLATLPLGLLLDALVHRVFGNTPGKALLALKVASPSGVSLGFAGHARRNLGLWLHGLALGLPLISLFTLVHQARRVGRGDPTSYDATQGVVVLAKPIGWPRKAGFGVVFSIMAIFMMALTSYEQQMEREAVVLRHQPHYAWENPITGASARIDPQWSYSVELNDEGDEIYMFAERLDRAFVLMGVEHVPDFSLHEYVEAFMLGTADNMRFVDGGRFGRRKGRSTWQGTGSFIDLGANRLHVEVAQTGVLFWRVVTIQTIPYDYSDALVDDLQNALWSTLQE